MVKAAEEWKISFKQHLLPIENEEQLLRYRLELAECGNTALHPSGIHRKISYV